MIIIVNYFGKILVALVLFSFLWSCNKKVDQSIFRDDQHIIAALSKNEKAQYWRNYKASIDLFKQYTKAMFLLDDKDQVDRNSIEFFCGLFQNSARVWNDIHFDPFLLEPMDYAIFVKKYLHKGVKAQAKQFGYYGVNLDRRYLRYYQVGDSEQEFYLHIAIEKTIYNGLDNELKEISYGKDGKVVLLDFVTYINNETEEVKIADIKPLLN